MRPRHKAAENLDLAIEAAIEAGVSMRPRHKAAENAAYLWPNVVAA